MTDEQADNVDSMVLLCVEPDSSRVFGLNLGTQQTCDYPYAVQDSIKNQIAREEFKLQELLGTGKNWDFGNQTAQRYRRSMLPFYLLHDESSLFPRYVNNATVTKNLTGDFKIKQLTVTLADSVLAALSAAVDGNKESSPT